MTTDQIENNLYVIDERILVHYVVSKALKVKMYLDAIKSRCYQLLTKCLLLLNHRMFTRERRIPCNAADILILRFF